MKDAEFDEEAWESRKAELLAQYPGIAGQYKVFKVYIETGRDPLEGDFSAHIAEIINRWVSRDDVDLIYEAIWSDAKLLNLPVDGDTELTVYESGEREDVFWNKFYRIATAPEGKKE